LARRGRPPRPRHAGGHLLHHLRRQLGGRGRRLRHLRRVPGPTITRHAAPAQWRASMLTQIQTDPAVWLPPPLRRTVALPLFVYLPEPRDGPERAAVEHDITAAVVALGLGDEWRQIERQWRWLSAASN